jgi:hypothetical protein
MAAYGDCQRLRYLVYHYGGKGLQRKVAALPLVNGDYIHKALASLITGHDLDSLIDALSREYKADLLGRTIHGQVDLDFLIGEQLSLLEGLTRAWSRVRLPALLAEFDVVDVEKEIAWDMAPGIRVMLRMDAVLRRKRDRLLFVKDYKTVGAVYDDWGKKFEHDSQLLCYTQAAEAIYGEPIGGLLMEALVKGRRSKERSTTSPFNGLTIQQSPFCYAYKSRAKDSGLPIFERSWSRGAEKIPVHEMPGGISNWLDAEFSDLDLNELFVPLPAIKPSRRDQERWRDQMICQEDRISGDVLEAEHARLDWEEQQTDEAWHAFQFTLNKLFPQNHNHCHRYSFNHPCPMEQLCFTEEIEADPLNSGLYEARIPHHATEEEDAA